MIERKIIQEIVVCSIYSEKSHCVLLFVYVNRLQSNICHFPSTWEIVQLINWWIGRLIDWVIDRYDLLLNLQKKQHNRSTIADLSIVYTKDSWRCFWLNKEKKLISVWRERETEGGWKRAEDRELEGGTSQNLAKIRTHSGQVASELRWFYLVQLSQFIEWDRLE